MTAIRKKLVIVGDGACGIIIKECVFCCRLLGSQDDGDS